MTRNANNRVEKNLSNLEQIDLDDMDKVSGGCAQCAQGGANGNKNQLGALAPALMGMSARR